MIDFRYSGISFFMIVGRIHVYFLDHCEGDYLEVSVGEQ